MSFWYEPGFRIPEDWEKGISEKDREREWRQGGERELSPHLEEDEQHLQMALTSLKNLLTSMPSLASLMASSLSLSPLFGCLEELRLPRGSRPVAELAMEVIASLTQFGPCVEALGGGGRGRERLRRLLEILHVAPDQRSGALKILHSLAGSQELSWTVSQEGGITFLLKLLVPTEDVPYNLRISSAQVLWKLISEPLNGPRILISLGNFLPEGMVAILREGPGEVVVGALNKTTETPELVWTPSMASSLAKQLQFLAEKVCLEWGRVDEGGRERVGEGEEGERGGGGEGGGVGGSGGVEKERGSGFHFPQTESFWRNEVQVGGVYVHRFLKDPKYPLRNPKRFLEDLLDQFVASAASARERGAKRGREKREKVGESVGERGRETETEAERDGERGNERGEGSGEGMDPDLPIVLSRALVALLRVQPMLAEHVAQLGYISKLVFAMASEGHRRVMSENRRGREAMGEKERSKKMGEGEEEEEEGVEGGEEEETREWSLQERIRLSCLQVLHQLSLNVSCSEAMASLGLSSIQMVALLMKAIGWSGGSALSLETLKRCLSPENRARDSLVAQSLKVGLVQVLLGILDWRSSQGTSFTSQMKWTESEASIGRVLAVEVLRCLSTEGLHSAKVQTILDSSEVWAAYKDQKHDLFLPTNALSAATGVAFLADGGSAVPPYALPPALSSSPSIPSTTRSNVRSVVPVREAFGKERDVLVKEREVSAKQREFYGKDREVSSKERETYEKESEDVGKKNKSSDRRQPPPVSERPKVTPASNTPGYIPRVGFGR